MQVLSHIRRIDLNSENKNKIRKSEFRLLMTLQHSDPTGTKVSELGVKMGITPAGVTHMINSLEKDAYLERLADPSDRRIVLVKLTGKGNALLKDMKADFLESLTGLINFLGENDSRNLLELLQKSFAYLSGEKRNATL